MRLLPVCESMLTVWICHLAEFSSKVWWALALVPSTAFSSIHAGQMANNDSEVGGGEGVRCMPVLTDDSSGVALLTAVLTAVVGAGHLADSRGEDHLDPAGVVPYINWVVSHGKRDGPVQVRSDTMHLRVSVVVFLLEHKLLCFALVHRH